MPTTTALHKNEAPTKAECVALTQAFLRTSPNARAVVERLQSEQGERTNPAKAADDNLSPEVEESRDTAIKKASPAALGRPDLHSTLLGGATYLAMIRDNLTARFGDGEFTAGALAHARAIMESLAPRDAAEEMLCVQMLLTHARVIYLNSVATKQSDRRDISTANEYADRASNTYRRMMLALNEYRRGWARTENTDDRTSKGASDANAIRDQGQAAVPADA